MPPSFPLYVSVVLDVSIDKALEYGVPPFLTSTICRGSRVEVPLRGFSAKGYVVAIKKAPEFTPVKPILAILSPEERLSQELFDLALWMARYYCTPLRKVFKTLVPGSLRRDIKIKQQLFVSRKKTREELQKYCINIRSKYPAQAEVLDILLPQKKGIFLSALLEQTSGSKSPIDTLVKKGMIAVEPIAVDRSPLIGEEYFQTRPKILNTEQQAAYDAIAKTLDGEIFQTHLLYGITGSGKTEIYLQAIQKTLDQGKSAIMLVPEIALTAQTIQRFRSRFEGMIAVLHHRLSHGERFDEWHKIHSGKAKIAIGARSAVFSPMANLGMIIVDEEHENSYKQGEEAPCYNARDVAVMRGKIHNCCVILGSATPSLESYYNAQKGKYRLNTLQQRASAASMPKVNMIDMRIEFEKNKGFTTFSASLIDAMKQRQHLGEQTLLFLNRRGYHASLQCTCCGKSLQCHQCAVSLTFHKGDNKLACHLCGYQISPPPTSCPQCNSTLPLKFRGVGTELIEKSLHALLPDIRTLRLDADTTRHKGSHERLLRDFGSGKADVLIGTQMVAKGLHFPLVTLVAILNSDASLNFPDFRAAETSFQLITQVSGRSGRGAIGGEVLIQTSMPDNSTIQHAASHNFENFYADEIAVREMFGYPPFSQMGKISLSGPNEKQALEAAEQFRFELIRQLPGSFQVHPVIPAGHAKVKNKFRFQFLIRGPTVYAMSRSIEIAAQQIKLHRAISTTVDINPLSTYF